jgi:Rrf2 family iron-sulfur cluster assembly transcriptional regulator
MDILRRNTDYALRLMVTLAAKHGREVLSTRALAKETLVSYQLACKLLQRLQKAELVQSSMGPKGGFTLTKAPETINLWKIIDVIQGPVNMNSCLLGDFKCQRRANCTIHGKLAELQKQIQASLTATTLDELLANRSIKTRHPKKHLREEKK